MGKRLKYKSQHHKSPRGDVGMIMSDIPSSNIFTDMFPRTRDIKKIINKWHFIKIKSFCMAKEIPYFSPFLFPLSFLLRK